MNRVILSQIFQWRNIGLRSYCRKYNCRPLFKNMLQPAEMDEYQSHMHYIYECVAKLEMEFPEDGVRRFKEILSYNLPNHAQDTGPIVLTTYKHFADSEKQSPENLHLLRTLGWTHDMIMRSTQITDDIMDLSETRGHKPCWYKVKNVGMSAINDSVWLGEASSQIVKYHFGKLSCYVPLMELTNELKYKVSLGQMLDVNVKFDNFSLDRFKIVADKKSTFLAFIDPVSRGMLFAEVFDDNIHTEVRSVLIKVGEYFMAQNDMMDCYGSFNKTGKYGTDIATGKYSWLAYKAVEDANPDQKQLFQKHYGKDDSVSQEIIYDLYNKLNIMEKFLAYEEETYNSICDDIYKMSGAIPRELMFKIVNILYGETDVIKIKEM